MKKEEEEMSCEDTILSLVQSARKGKLLSDGDFREMLEKTNFAEDASFPKRDMLVLMTVGEGGKEEGGGGEMWVKPHLLHNFLVCCRARGVEKVKVSYLLLQEKTRTEREEHVLSLRSDELGFDQDMRGASFSNSLPSVQERNVLLLLPEKTEEIKESKLCLVFGVIF
jgi:hypothetical protein